MRGAFASSLGFRITSSISRDRKSTRLNSSHSQISYAVFCLKKKKSDHVGISRKRHDYQQLTFGTLVYYNLGISRSVSAHRRNVTARLCRHASLLILLTLTA